MTAVHTVLYNQKLIKVFENQLKKSHSSVECMSTIEIISYDWFSRQVIPWTAMDCVWERNPDGMPSSQRSNFKREKMQNRSAKRLSCLTSETLIWEDTSPSLSTCLDRVRLLFDSDLSRAAKENSRRRTALNKSFTHGLKWNVKCVTAFSAFP